MFHRLQNSASPLKNIVLVYLYIYLWGWGGTTVPLLELFMGSMSIQEDSRPTWGGAVLGRQCRRLTVVCQLSQTKGEVLLCHACHFASFICLLGGRMQKERGSPGDTDLQNASLSLHGEAIFIPTCWANGILVTLIGAALRGTQQPTNQKRQATCPATPPTWRWRWKAWAACRRWPRCPWSSWEPPTVGGELAWTAQAWEPGGDGRSSAPKDPRRPGQWSPKHCRMEKEIQATWAVHLLSDRQLPNCPWWQRWPGAQLLILADWQIMKLGPEKVFFHLDTWWSKKGDTSVRSLGTLSPPLPAPLPMQLNQQVFPKDNLGRWPQGTPEVEYYFPKICCSGKKISRQGNSAGRQFPSILSLPLAPVLSRRILLRQR